MIIFAILYLMCFRNDKEKVMLALCSLHSEQYRNKTTVSEKPFQRVKNCNNQTALLLFLLRPFYFTVSYFQRYNSRHSTVLT